MLGRMKNSEGFTYRIWVVIYFPLQVELIKDNVKKYIAHGYCQNAISGFYVNEMKHQLLIEVSINKQGWTKSLGQQ